MTIHDIACTTFTFTCPWGCTVQVEEGREADHLCAGTSAVLDALHDAHHQPGSITMPQLAEHVARQLDPTVRVLKADSWETGVRDGRGGETFSGIDPEPTPERLEDADV